MPQFDKASYISYVEMSDNDRILVEGMTDKQAFGTARSIFSGSISNFEIDSAEDLINFGNGVGNRQKVEEVCNDIAQLALSNNFVGFCDREFRDFQISNSISDEIDGHQINGHLIWTKGHSIENYIFDLTVIGQVLFQMSKSINANLGINKFRNLFEQTLNIASALTMTIGSFGFSYSRVMSSISHTAFNSTDHSISIDKPKFREGLLSRNFSQVQITQFLDTYDSNLSICERSALDTKKWYCHGHVGLRTIRLAYAHCLEGVLDSAENINNSFLTISIDYLLHFCMIGFLSLERNERNDFPDLIFEELGNLPPQKMF